MVRLKPSARRDLLAIREWGVTAWGGGRAREFLEDLITALERLTEQPLLGRSRAALMPGLRSIRFRSYVVFYVIDADGPVFLSVLHERRNHAALDFADRMEGEG
jgi:toxin ParE1/3/4